jgi:hypothetical protein
VLPLFENARPGDDRPRRAIEQCREWVRTGVFSMSAIRGASLSAHAAARDMIDNQAACYAARAAGQAVATAHVPQHAFGGAYYALKGIAAADPANAEANVAKEWEWEVGRAPENLREEVSTRIVIQNVDNKMNIRVLRGTDF